MRRSLRFLLLAGLFAAAPARAQDFVVQACFPSYCINEQENPTLSLTRGTTYQFQVAASGHPFYIKTAPVTGTGSAYNSGVTNNGTQNGFITFTVPNNAPSTLYYNCSIHGSMSGLIEISGGSSSVPGLTPVTAAVLAGLVVLAGLRFLRRRKLDEWTTS